MLGFTLTAFNVGRVHSFPAKHHLDEQERPTEKLKQTRARRRTGTWADVIESSDEGLTLHLPVSYPCAH